MLPACSRHAQGDFSDAEKAELLQAGAVGIGLGQLRLRTETAAVALCAACALL
jgi:16S rRNA U1498 N3-methylase RsmE